MTDRPPHFVMNREKNEHQKNEKKGSLRKNQKEFLKKYPNFKNNP